MKLSDGTAIAASGLAYCLLACATIWITDAGAGIATIWPANAILLAIVWTLPRNRWLPYFLACFAGNVIANMFARDSLLASLPFGIANMAEVAMAALLLGRTRNSGEAFAGVRQVARFGVIAGVLAPGFSALLGAATAKVLYDAGMLQAYLTWFTADALGLLIVTPVALMLRDGELLHWYRQLSRQARSHAAGLFLLVIATTCVTFGQSGNPLLFLVFGPTILASCRLGRAGAVLSVVAVAAIGTFATMHDAGPLGILGDDWTKVIVFQLFLAVLMMTALPAAAELDSRRQLIAKLAEREAALLLMMDRSSDLILNFDRDGTCVFASGSSASLADYTPGIVVGANVVDLPHPHDAGKAKFNLVRALDDPAHSHRCEYRLNDGGGGWFWVEASTRALTDADGQVTGAVSVLRDVSHHKRQEADLRMAAITDELTGLANRSGFVDAFERELPATDRIETWVGLLDLDHFKTVNDRHGHLAGDEVLRAVANRLRAELRPDDVLARIGGEEFAVILVSCSETTASTIFERLRSSVCEAPVAVAPGVALSLTLSAGFVKLTPELSREQILAAADEALYFSKRAGRNRVTIGIARRDALAA